MEDKENYEKFKIYLDKLVSEIIPEEKTFSNNAEYMKYLNDLDMEYRG